MLSLCFVDKDNCTLVISSPHCYIWGPRSRDESTRRGDGLIDRG